MEAIMVEGVPANLAGTPVATAKTPRRKNRCMFRDDRGRWWLDYYTPDGKRRRKLAGKTKADADKLLRQIRTSVDKGEYVDAATAPGFSDFCDIFMERHGKHKVSYLKNGYPLERLKTFFGNKNLARITAGDIEQYRLARLADKSARDGKSALKLTTVNREVEMLRSVLGKAVKWGKLGRNPATQVEDYDEDNKRLRFLSNDEIRGVLRATKLSKSAFLRPAVYLALQTGMRRGELLGLRWSDVDFESNKILARDTKTGIPRHVPMSRRARWALSKMAARNPLAEWVFQSRNQKGELAAAQATNSAWPRALRLARIENFHFHDLRHTFASHFAMKGGNLYALSQILGHNNPAMTLKRYTHSSPEFMNDQRRTMDKTYSNGHQMDTRAASAA
jgi:integrase